MEGGAAQFAALGAPLFSPAPGSVVLGFESADLTHVAAQLVESLSALCGSTLLLRNVRPSAGPKVEEFALLRRWRVRGRRGNCC